MTNAEIILGLEDYAIDPIFQLVPGLVKTLQFAAHRLRDYGACEAELRRITGAETMRGVVDIIKNGGGDGQEAAY